MIKAYGPVLAQLVLTTDNAATFGLYLRGERGSECGVIAKKARTASCSRAFHAAAHRLLKSTGVGGIPRC